MAASLNSRCAGAAVEALSLSRHFLDIRDWQGLMTQRRRYSQIAGRRALARVKAWFKSQGWSVFRYQQRTWNLYLQGNSGLVHSTTGTGKTLAVWMGPIVEALAESEQRPEVLAEGPLRILWITPLRALA
ncbi:MAG: DEAD/DEAH box helicase, partial [Planctomycetaceae bacterium]